MTCNDYFVVSKLGDADVQFADFQQLLNGPHAAHGLRRELREFVTQGQQFQQDFAATTEALIERGFR